MLELFRSDRLCYVVGSARIDRLHGMLDRGISGHHDERDVIALLSQVSEKLESGHPWHFEIRDDQLDLTVRKRLQRLRDVPRTNCSVARTKQRVFEQQTDRWVIIDVQDRRHRPASVLLCLSTGAGAIPADTRIPDASRRCSPTRR